MDGKNLYDDYRYLDIDLKDLIDIVRQILRKGFVECIDLSRENVSTSKLLTALQIIGCRGLCVCEDDHKRKCSLEELGFYEDISPSPLRVFENTEELLYRNWPTPLVKLRSLSKEDFVVWAKLEYYNPYSMSIKDRISWYMIKNLLLRRREFLKKIFYEATSTNTGMALTSLANILGFKTRLFIPSTIQKASDIILKVLGADVIRRPERLTIEMIDKVEEMSRSEGGIHLNQFDNDYNFIVHLRYTAKELDLQIRYRGIKIRGLIAGIGTSGHFSALSLYMKSRYGDHVKTFAVQPSKDSVIPGIRRIESGMKWIHMIPYDMIIDVSTEEAVKEAVNIARREGLFIGLSSGAVVAGFKKLYEENIIEPGEYILIFPDHGFKYIEQFNKYLESRES